MAGQNDFTYVYGANQKGQLIEYKIPNSINFADPLATMVTARPLLMPNDSLPDRDRMVFQDVYAIGEAQRTTCLELMATHDWYTTRSTQYPVRRHDC